jgi:ATP-dependent Clp protease ATP-binding subunit ClpC
MLCLMFERFSERARQVVVFAQEEARALKHNYIGTEHILLGLLCERDGVGARVLESVGVSLEPARAQVVGIVGVGEEATAGQIPFTPRAKKVLELALREALGLGHNYIGTEHILLALARSYEGVAARVLLDFEASPEKIRNAVIALLSGSESRQRGGATTGGRGDFRMFVGPDSNLLRLLMAAGGRALAQGRHEFGLDDLLTAVKAMDDAAVTEDAEPHDPGSSET